MQHNIKQIFLKSWDFRVAQKSGLLQSSDPTEESDACSSCGVDVVCVA
jgi:hypothetical protein